MASAQVRLRRALLLPLLLTACAGSRMERSQPLRISTTHYRSMAGVTLNDGDAETTCKREMITGSHIPRWYCSFGTEPGQFALDRRIGFAAE
jgi:hypothetical protein